MPTGSSSRRPASRITPWRPADHPVVHTTDGTWEGRGTPTSELALHVGVMRAMPEVGAIVHTHSRYAAAFAVARLGLPFICNENIATRSERVLVTAYAPPGSVDLADQAIAALRRQPGSRAVLLANHGVVAVAPTLEEAYVVAQSVEWTAEICHLARTLIAAGTGEHVLDRAVQDAIARNYGVVIAQTTTQALMRRGVTRRLGSPGPSQDRKLEGEHESDQVRRCPRCGWPRACGVRWRR